MSNMDLAKAKALLQAQIEKSQEIQGFKRFGPEWQAWKRDTEVLIEKVFPKSPRNLKDFTKISYAVQFWTIETPESADIEAYNQGLETARHYLTSMIRELDLYTDSVDTDTNVKVPLRQAGNMTTLFLSHASEDKDDLVRPLAERLEADFKVWYDDYELVLGDSLLQKINSGLTNCDYGVVVLSQHFFAKKWPKAELDGLFALETNERKVILPIWKDVSEDDVRAFSPILASRLGVPFSDGIDRIILEIKRAVGLTERVRDLAQIKWRQRFASLDEDISHRKAVEARNRTIEGVKQVADVARQILAEGRSRAEELERSLKAVGLYIPPKSKCLDNEILVKGPGLITLGLRFDAPTINAVEHITFRIAFFRDESTLDGREFEPIEVTELKPKFDREFKLFWQNDTRTFSSGDAILDFAFDRFAELLEKQLGSANR